MMTPLQMLPIAGPGSLPETFLIRLAINMLSAFFLIRYIYYPLYKNRENVFLFSIFNLLIFIISYLLNSVDIGMGSAFGLFAVFSILQYRTVKISTKDMTYILLLISLGLIHAVSMAHWGVLSLISLFLLATTYFLESGTLLKKEAAQTIVYKNLKLIRPEERKNLQADLEARLGVKITVISVREVDFEKESALINICYSVGADGQAVKKGPDDPLKERNGSPAVSGMHLSEIPLATLNGHGYRTLFIKAKSKNKERRGENGEDPAPMPPAKKRRKKQFACFSISRPVSE
ncbi:DUF4956 domain-containing protein [Paraflavisolibacter sp. H34]|uniref:DUF4956 domain-containing protein n=1 Tax=Huijunlia imazamoxiresistens TaxID=3127457 RepID=UPI00301B183D